MNMENRTRKENCTRKVNRTRKAIKQHKAVELGQEITRPSLIDVLLESLLMNIIARLPIASIHACRCVCKLFRRLISEKYFTERFVEMSPYTTIVFNNDVGVHLVELAKGYCKSYKSILPSNKAKLVGSCNGLLCLFVYFENGPYCCWCRPALCVCNPVLGQYAILPEPSNIHPGPRNSKDVYGFGFSSATGHYKILRIPTPIYKKRSVAEVLIVGTNTWRSVGYLPYPSSQEFPAATVNGALHWLFYDEIKNSTSLYAFNIKEERDYQIPFPPNIENRNVNISVGVLNNCLCMFDNSDPAQFSIWSMKKYGVGESWTFKCILTASITAGLDTSTLHPVAVLKNDGIFIKSGSGNFYFYDQKNMDFTRLEIDNVELLAEVNSLAVHSSTFCPLDFMATGCLMVDKVSSRCTGHSVQLSLKNVSSRFSS